MRNFDWRPGVAAGMFSICCLTSLAWAAQQDDPEARLRASLRAATVQLRDLQDQNGQLLAKQAEAERERMALAQKLAADEKELSVLRQQVRSGQIASQQATAQIEAGKENFAKLESSANESLAKWEAAYKEAADTARTRDADAKRLDAALIQTRGRAQTCEAKNAELFKLGKEVLGFYDNRNFFGAIGASEPFTKLKRVQYENLMQDYEDRLRANDLAHPAPATAP